MGLFGKGKKNKEGSNYSSMLNLMNMGGDIDESAESEMPSEMTSKKKDKDSPINLYNVFMNENKRVGDEFIVAYNNNKMQLTYQMLSGEGKLTVKFGRDVNGNREDFYFSKQGQSNQLVYEIVGNGYYARPMDEFFDIPVPTEMRRIIDGYKDLGIRKKEIGIDKAMAKAFKKKNINVDR